MSRDQDLDSTLLEDRAQLVDYFRGGFKSPENRGVGTEHEKFVFRKSDHQLISFSEIETLFGKLEAFGWEPQLDRGRTVALVRNGEAITLEPAGQLELSGAVKKTIFETDEELRRHFDELRQVAGDDYDFTCWGMNPFDRIEDLEFVPKARYDIMKAYLPTRGDLSHWMMKLTCTIQANVDFTSEEDATTMIRGAYLATPFIAALFANSPIHHGNASGYQSFRNNIWTRVDPDRTGIPDFVVRTDWGFEDYVEYVLDVPMFFIRRGDRYVDMSGTPFRTFWEKGFEGFEATMGDFELHLSTVFPEVRMKRYVEVRCGDGGPLSHMLALPALWKGLIYSDNARRETCSLLCHYDADDVRENLRRSTREGIHADATDGRPFNETLRELVAIASRSLDEIAANAGHESEGVYLAPLIEIVETGRSAADRLLDDWERLGHDRAALIEAHRLF